jgi:formate hydrogenlyase subunit 4
MQIIVNILISIAIVLGGIVVGLVYKGIDRKLAAKMQSRIGPPIRQPFRDVRKLLVKENIVPDNAIEWVFNSMPVISLAAALTILLYLPIGSFKPVLSGHGDLILLVYLFAIPALAMVIGGFASASPYATVGAQREIILMLSYEFPLAIAIIAVAYKLSVVHPDSAVFSLSFIITHPLWQIVGPVGIIGIFFVLASLLVVTPAEMSKVPFDAPEAETELAGGILVEYSGRNLALFYIADAVKTVAFAALIVALFFPYGIGHLFGVNSILASIIDVAFFLVKLFLLILAAITTVRVAFARFKIDQIIRFFWIPVTTTAIAGLVLMILDTALK